MKIEIVDFYPLERNDEKELMTGTVRIKLPDIGIHILGVFVSKRKDYWHISLPGRLGTHHQSGESIRYPFVVFEDNEKQKALMNAIREQTPIFIERRLSDKEKPLIFPEKNQKRDKKKKPTPADVSKQSKTSDQAIMKEETVSKANPKSVSNEMATKAKQNPVVEETASTVSPSIMQSIASKKWIDPPKRKG